MAHVMQPTVSGRACTPRLGCPQPSVHRKRQSSKHRSISVQFTTENAPSLAGTSTVHSARQPTRKSSRCRTRIGTSLADGAIVTTVVDTPKLMDIVLEPIVNRQGLVFPNVPDGVQAIVFAIYDSRQKLQYVGFSKDLRNSLRTVFSRRPDKAHFYKATYLTTLDQQHMINIRDTWFEECGGAPPGNHLVMERTAWQQPVDAGAISQRGKRGAADETASQLLVAMKARGCKEDFVPNPTLLEEGMVDFLPAEALNDAEVAERRAAAEEILKVTRVGKALVDGQEKVFSVHYDRKTVTNNGFMMDIVVTFDNQDTVHRVIIGKEYYEAEQVDAEHVVEAALTLLIEKKVPRQTEGLILSSQFPINYFSITGVEQWFGDEFNDIYERCTGKVLGAHAGFWRFNRIHSYGSAMVENPPSVGLFEGVNVAQNDAVERV